MASAAEGRGLPWTDEAKFQLLLRIVAQLREGGKPIDWQKIRMPGRTPKSLSNMWCKINKMIGELDQGQGRDAAPVEKPTPRKKASKAKLIVSIPDDDDDGDDDDDEESQKKTIIRKRSAADFSDGTFKKLKREKLDDDLQDEKIMFKSDPDIFENECEI
ncbi:hypothetical protein QQS21_010508 [Conoideocrella luteorostrata]|uniref:Uncharacterized protein n=1 Tax=Conoideocrella luteorostrata TaxID=1105319 RepID=A0AAJ0FPC9_9HYPO|nr:hypothetical protein QQS21_010508 [Conoideocrella luteorostrata]